jgi:sugar lactone lactonase YvrE
MRIRSALCACACLTLAACADHGVVDPNDATAARPTASKAAAAAVFPDVIPLPDGFSPEGIAFGKGTTFYVGSIPTGAIYRADARTGAGDLLVQPHVDRQASGLEFDARKDRLFVAGGMTGQAYVYDATTGATLGVYQLTAPGSLVNDVVVTGDAAYFTDSFRPVIYRLPLASNGSLPPAGAAQEIALTGDFQFLPGQFNGNGIDATPNGKELILVNSTTGKLYRVDPETGVTSEIDLGGGAVPAGDGILLDGRDLYVVQGFLNQIAVVRLSPDLSSGAIARVITDPAFRIPSTVDEFGSSLYAVNARFDVAPPPAPAPGVKFEVVRVAKH